MSIIVMGLDSADANLMELWLAEGRLPFMKSLLEKGVWTRLTSIANGFSDAPWLSFNTGVLPGKHGSYNFLELQRETIEIDRVNARSCQYPPFWSLLRNTDTKVALFDIPKTYPIEGIQGVQISAWGEEYPMFPPCSLPEDLIAEITARFGQYTHPRELLNPRLISQQVRRYQTLMTEMDRKREAVRFVMNQGNWDLLMTSFGEAHYGNHLFYHLFNQEHWAYDPVIAAQLKDALPNIYSKLDTTLESLLTDISEETTLFIISVHGISTNYSANHLMPLVMEKLGFQVRPSQENNSSWPSWQKIREAIPAPVRDFINDWLLPQSFHDQMHSQQFSQSIDWPKTKAFFIPLGHFQGFISINLKGRDPYGTVEPGTEYEEICDQICQELKLLINPQTGQPAIKEIIPITQLLQGERLAHLPDILIRWAEESPIDQLYHPKFGKLSGEYYGLRKTQHTGEGFILAVGQHINQAAQLTNVRAVDLAPTMLYLMGQPIPRYMEGKVLLDLFDESFKQTHSLQYDDHSLVIA